MGSVTTVPRTEGLTAVDLEGLPDDGNRYEILDGRLLVTPSPQAPHQGAVVELTVILRTACPPHLRLLIAPFDVALAANTVVQPDLLVARRSDVRRANLPAAPLLAVEVLSPSTRERDLGVKRGAYERFGVASYWVVDPEAPSLTAWDLRDGRYVELAKVRGEQSFRAERPFAVEVVPARLLD